MIEKTLLDYLSTKLNPVPCFMEIPANRPTSFVLLERTGRSISNHLPESTFTIKCFADSLYNAAVLSDELEQALFDFIESDEIRNIVINSSYDYSDVDRKEYIYQTVVEIYHY